MKDKRYYHFLNGDIKTPFDKSLYGVGYIGVGNYTKNGNPQAYKTWSNMLRRCYDNKLETYTDCTVSQEWHDFQKFCSWYEDNFYQITEDCKIHLDKDILIKGNKIYSKDNCVFVPQKINSLFIKSNKSRGKYPIGVTFDKRRNKYYSCCCDGDNNKIHLGSYPTPEDAFYAYKEYKESVIREITEQYKDKIPSRLYDTMMKYEVEIID